MRRRDASTYLLEKHGVSLTQATLAKLATVGGGPMFRKDGKYPLYDRVELDAFAVARLGPLRASTSDIGHPLAAASSPTPRVAPAQVPHEQAPHEHR
jgi:hypothetical protein